MCTLSRGCFSDLGHPADTDGEASVMNLDRAKLDLATAQSLKLTEAAKSFIYNLLKSIDTSASVEIMQPRSDTTPIEPIAIDIAKPVPVEDCWSRCGDVVLSRKDLQIILGGKELSDLHIDAFQNLVKMQFPHIGGLQTMLLQTKLPLKCNGGETLLQVNH